MKIKTKLRKILSIFIVAIIMATTLSIPVSASGTGNVSQAIESSWKETLKQIKDVADKVVFPAIAVILGVLFFVKLATAYFDCASVKAI